MASCHLTHKPLILFELTCATSGTVLFQLPLGRLSKACQERNPVALCKVCTVQCVSSCEGRFDLAV